MCRAKVNGREEALTLQFVVFLSQCAAIEELVGHTHIYIYIGFTSGRLGLVASTFQMMPVIPSDVCILRRMISDETALKVSLFSDSLNV